MLAILVYFFLFSLVKAQTEDVCFSSTTNLCSLCRAPYYNSDPAQAAPFEKKNCLSRTLSPIADRTVYVSPRPFAGLGAQSTALKIYENLISAFYSEDMLSSALAGEGRRVLIKLLRNVHYILPSDLSSSSSSLFLRNNIEIEISPLLCQEAPGELQNSCYQPNEYATIKIKTNAFTFYVSKKLTIRSLVLDGQDLPFFFSNDPCQDALKNCCSEFPSQCSDFSGSRPFSTKSSATGLIVVEPIFDVDAIASPRLVISNCKLVSLVFTERIAEPATSPTSFILFYDFPGGVTIESTIASDCFFPTGMVLKLAGFRPFYDNIIKDASTLVFSEPVFQVVMQKVSVINYNTQNFATATSGLYRASLLSLNNFKGKLSLDACTFAGFFMPNEHFAFVQNTKSLKSESLINISSSTFYGNDLLSILFLSDFYTRDSFTGLLAENTFGSNSLKEFLTIRHLKAFNLSGSFLPPFSLPSRSFITSFHSNLNFVNAVFTNLQTALAEFALVKITSAYAVTTEAVFTTAKRKSNIYFSNETTQFLRSSFANSSFLLFNSPNLNYRLRLELCSFDNFSLYLHDTKPFVDLVSEGPLVVVSVSFKNFLTKSNLIAARPFLNASIFNLSLERINVNSRDAIYFFSVTLSDKFEHQINISEVQASDVFFNITPESLGKLFICVIYCFSPESGKGPAAVLSNISVRNIHHNRVHIKHHALRIDNCVMNASNISGFNISNSIFFAHNPRTGTSDLFLNNMQFYNPPGISLYRLFECGVSYYTRGEFTNSKFSAGSLLFNSAAGFNLAQTLVLRNLTFDLYQETGTLLFAQVTRLSTMFVTDLYVKGRSQSGAALFTIATEIQESGIPWSNGSALEANLLSKMYSSFGVFNSVFEDAFVGAIILLVQTQVLFQNITFRRTAGNEGGVIRLAQNSKVVFFLCNFSDSLAYNFGGAFSVEGSNLILISVKLNNSQGRVRGGVINAVDSVVIIRGSLFENGASLIGGFVFADSSLVSIFNSFFRNGTVEKYGGHIVCKQGEITVLGCLFENGESKYLGGSLFLEAVYYNITKADFVRCRSKVGTLYSISGEESTTSIIMNTRFVDNQASKSGGAIYSSDVNIHLLRVLLKGNEAGNGVLCVFFGLFLKPVVTFEFVYASNNKVSAGLYSIEDVNLFLTHAYLMGNKLSRQCFLSAVKSNLNIRSLYFAVHDRFSPSDKESFEEHIFVISARITNIDISASAFELQQELSMLSCIECSNVTIQSSSFREGSGNLGGIFNLRLSKFYGSVLYLANSHATQGGGFYATGSTIKLSECLFRNNFAEKDGSDILTVALEKDFATTVTAEKTSFLNVSKTSVKVEYQNVFLKGAHFYGNASGECQALFAEGGLIISIEASEFANFFNKSVLYVQNQEASRIAILISSSVFKRSSAPLTEGAFVKTFGETDLKVSQSTFLQGHALSGGSIYFSCPTRQCLFELSNNNFSQNTADNAGGAVSSESLNLTSLNCTFSNNSAFVGENTNFFPTDFLLFLQVDSKPLNQSSILSYILNGPHEDCLILADNSSLKVVPGYKFSIGVAVIDKNRNIQYNEDKTQASISIIKDRATNSSTYHSFTNNLAGIFKGVGVFESISIVGKTNMTVTAQVVYKTAKYEIRKNLSIEVQKCHRGDSYIDNICSPCPEDFFSLNPSPEATNQSCLRCPDNSKCTGGDIIIPNRYYWRKNYNSSKVIKCKTKYGCPDQAVALFSRKEGYEYMCQKGYEGNLCEACSKGYGDVKNQCVLCSENQGLFVLLIMSGVGIYILYIHHQERRSEIKSADQQVAQMKILINHVSIFVMLSALKVNWSEFFKDFFTITSSYASSTPSSIFSWDCIFEWSPDDKIIGRMIIAGLSPLALIILAFITNMMIESVISFAKNRRATQKGFPNFSMFLGLHFRPLWLYWEFLKHFTFIYINIYPQVLLNMFNIFGCKSIDDTDDLYLSQYPWIECNSDFHKKTWGASITFLLFWGFLSPAVIYYLVWTYHKENPIRLSVNSRMFDNFEAEIKQNKIDKAVTYESEKIKSNRFVIFNFVTKGYQERYYWWELTVFARKLLFLSIATFSEEMDSVSIGGITILLLSSFLIISLWYQPYDSSSLVVLEALSILVSVISICMGMITSFDEEDVSSILKSICSVVLIVSNIFFFVIWFILYFTKLAKLFLPRLVSRMETKFRTSIVKAKVNPVQGQRTSVKKFF